MDPIRSAVIGIGGIGKWHAAMQRDTGRMKVTALCDSNESLKDWAQEEFPEAKFYAGYEEMFAQEKLGLVSIVTPHNLHAPMTIQALDAGINVVTEKPMATTYEDARAMLAAAERNQRFVTVFHNRRLDPWFLAAKAVLDEGLLGRLIEINIGINYGPGPQTWRGYKEPSGGLMFDWGAHLVDYCLHFDPSEVKAVAGSLYRSPDTPADRVEDHAVVHVHFASGVEAHITSSGKATIQPDRYRLVGERGTLLDKWEWDEKSKLKVQTRLGSGDPAEIQVAYRKTDTQDFYNNLADQLCDHKPLMVSGESAAKVINVLCTAERSAAQGGVPLPLA